MREAGLLVGRTLELLARRGARRASPRSSWTALAEDFIRSHGGVPNFQLVPGYSHTLCTSVNDEVVHGIPRQPRAARGRHRLDRLRRRGRRAGTATPPSRPSSAAARPAAPRTSTSSPPPRPACMPASPRMRVGGRLYAVGEAVEASIEAAAERDGRVYGDHRGLRRPRHRHADARGPADPQLRRARRGPEVRRRLHRRHRADGHPRQRPTRRCSPTTGPSSTDDGTRAAHWEHSVAVRDDGPVDPHGHRRWRGGAGSPRRGIRPAGLTDPLAARPAATPRPARSARSLAL